VLKRELIQRVAGGNPHLRASDAEKIVNTIFEEMMAAMARGDRVELRGTGAFTVRVRRPTGPKSKDRERSRRARETCSPFQAGQANARTPEWRLDRVTRAL
jgi:integration host factor subunit beta